MESPLPNQIAVIQEPQVQEPKSVSFCFLLFSSMDHNFAQCAFMLDDRQPCTVPHLLDLAPYQPSAANNCLQHPILHRFLDWSLPTNPPAQWVHSQAWFPSKICSFWPENETNDQEPLPSASFQKWALLAFCSIVIWGAQAPKASISPGCLTTCNLETHNNFAKEKHGQRFKIC